MYVENSLKGIHNYNPKPGFSQIKWIEEYSRKNPYIVPLYEAYKAGMLFTHEVQIVPAVSPEKIDFIYAVHLHLFYLDLADLFADYFKNLSGTFDLLITVTEKDVEAKVIQAFSQCGARDIKIMCVENIGRDSGPLFFGLKDTVLEGDYEVIGHFHSKKSFDIKGGMGDRWRTFLMDNLIGDETVARSVLSIFNDPNIGLIFPDDMHVVDIGKNKEYADSLCEMLDLPTIEQTPIFPLGNMFWARVEAVKGLFSLDPSIVLQKEPLPYDGSYMHALERITPHLVEQRGYTYTTVYKAGTTW